jgi:hypothetical protein
MRDDAVDNHVPSSSNPPTPSSNSAAYLQKFETSPEYCISVLNNLGTRIIYM